MNALVELLEAVSQHLDAILKLMAAIGGPIVAWVLARLGRQRVQQEEDKHRESHTLDLFRALSESNAHLQLAASSVLVERLRRLKDAKRKSPIDHSEEASIEHALHSMLKGDRQVASDQAARAHGVSLQLSKYVAEQIVRLNQAQPLENGRPLDIESQKSEYLKPPKNPVSPLKRFDWQKVKIVEAWWPGLDGRGVDFFKAELLDCGMRYAQLEGVVFYEARLCGTTLRGAKLKGANFQSADLERTDLREADLRRANLSGARNWAKAKWEKALYCPQTRFPEGFSPEQHGMALAEADVLDRRPAR